MVAASCALPGGGGRPPHGLENRPPSSSSSYALLDRGRNGLARLAAQAGLLVHQDGDAAQGAHFVGARCDGDADAELLLHALLHAAQVSQAGDALEPGEQLLLFGLGQLQDACVAIGGLEQGVPVADTGAGRALRADGEGDRLHGGRGSADLASGGLPAF